MIADTLPEALGALVLDWHAAFAAGEDAVMIARRNRDVAELNARARELLAAGADARRSGARDRGPAVRRRGPRHHPRQHAAGLKPRALAGRAVDAAPARARAAADRRR